MDFTPQVETAEIADADLDNVSGGLLAPVNGVLETAGSVSANDVVGLATDVAGVNTAPVTGLAGL